ncbi:hypothetical protein NB689_003424 [Xanthomonas sacchari]|nr:hypothetical protein [Xanthomonas sacchari]
MSRASMRTSASKRAPGSLRSCDQRCTAASKSAPLGPRGVLATQSKVTWSGATMPARAPASIDMLHRVMRCSMSIASMVEPRYSSTWPVPPLTPITPMMCRITSLAPTPGASGPSTVIAMVLALRCSRHWVASTWPTSLVPMPNASAPNAPCVEVWLSPQTMVMPGWVKPCSGAITWTMPRLSEPMSNSSMP